MHLPNISEGNMSSQIVDHKNTTQNLGPKCSVHMLISTEQGERS